MRRVERLVIPGIRSEKPGERDNGKTFILTEMDAYAGQDWALRVLLAMAKGGVQLPEGGLNAPWETLAQFAITSLARAPYGDIRPLLEQMLGQARYAHAPDNKAMPTQEIAPGPNCPVEEIKTFMAIQSALWKLHAGFSEGASTPTTA